MRRSFSFCGSFEKTGKIGKYSHLDLLITEIYCIIKWSAKRRNGDEYDWKIRRAYRELSASNTDFHNCPINPSGDSFCHQSRIKRKEKRELLSQINKAVSEINTTVNSLNEKKTEVVYIDNRIPQAPVCPPAVETAPEAAETKPESSAKEEEQTDEVKEEATAEAEVKTQTVKKFFERDCAVSKTAEPTV